MKALVLDVDVLDKETLVELAKVLGSDISWKETPPLWRTDKVYSTLLEQDEERFKQSEIYKSEVERVKEANQKSLDECAERAKQWLEDSGYVETVKEGTALMVYPDGMWIIVPSYGGELR